MPDVFMKQEISSNKEEDWKEPKAYEEMIHNAVDLYLAEERKALKCYIGNYESNVYEYRWKHDNKNTYLRYRFHTSN